MIASLILAAALTAPPRPTEYVTDNANAVSSSTVRNLDAELKRYEDTTGHRIIVWIGQTTGDVPLENWTIKAAETWKIGRKGKDDGAILFLFMQDHRIRIEVGYGLEGSLTDADSSRIINETIRPKMRAGDVDGAVQDGVDRMLLTITPSFAGQIGHEVAAAQSSSGELPAGIIAAVIIFILVLIVPILGLIIFASRKQRGGRGNPGLWFFGSALGSALGSGLSGGGDFGGGLGGGGFGGGFGGGGASGGW